MDEIEARLAKDTNGWMLPFVTRMYSAGPEGQKAAEQESVRLLAHEYTPAGESVFAEGDRHVNVRRTAARTVMTGGIGLILFGASRSKGREYATANWRLAGSPFQPREVTIYANCANMAIKCGPVDVIKGGVFNAFFQVSGSVTSTQVGLERAEFEVSLYRTPDLTRIEIGRFEIVQMRYLQDWHLKLPGHHPANTKATAVVVPRRVMPTNGIWQEPVPQRVLWQQMFPRSELNGPR
jgi:hypothetical protein